MAGVERHVLAVQPHARFRSRTLAPAALAALALAACGGRSGDALVQASPWPVPTKGSSSGGAAVGVGGTVQGLVGSGLALSCGGAAFAVPADGAFACPDPVPSGAAYAVTVAAQPAAPAQVCTVANGAGTAGQSAVLDVWVRCDLARSLSANVSGLSGAGLVLHLEAGAAEDLPVAADGVQTFSTHATGGTPYAITIKAQPAGQTCAVTGGRGAVAADADVTAAVACGVATSLDLAVDGAYVTQGTQTYRAGVPLVAGRAGLLRVFVRANQANAARPSVLVRLVADGSTAWVRTIPAPGGSVPTSVAEGNLAASWNLALAPADLPAGSLQFQITVNADQAVAEADLTDDEFTLSATALSVPTWRVTLVPVVLANGTGNVTAANAASWVDRVRRLHPVADVDVTVASPFTPSVTAVTSGGTGWDTVLSDLDKKRIAEGTGRYYFGALHTPYSSGVAGLGYIGYPAAIGWDRTGLPDYGNYPEVLAHEVGHNFGRQHAPCGNPSGVDATWPKAAAYANALIGAWGWDVNPGGTSPSPLKDPASTHDIMSYCPGIWASDYTYQGVLAFRRAGSGRLAVGASAARRSLVVTGFERDGAIELRPAFEVEAAPSPQGGEHALELLDGNGVVVRRVTFELEEVGDHPGAARHFAVVVPVDDLDPTPVAELAVTKAGRTLARRARPAATRAAPRSGLLVGLAAGAVRGGAARSRLGWDAAAAPHVMVRDPRTGEVVGFGDGGSLEVASDAPELEVHFSDGVRSAPRRVLVN